MFISPSAVSHFPPVCCFDFVFFIAFVSLCCVFFAGYFILRIWGRRNERAKWV